MRLAAAELIEAGRTTGRWPGRSSVTDVGEPVAGGASRRRPSGAGLQRRGRRQVQAQCFSAAGAGDGAGRRSGPRAKTTVELACFKPSGCGQLRCAVMVFAYCMCHRMS